MSTNKDTTKPMPFGRLNYLLLIGGMALVILGLLLMSGGGSEDPNEFNPAVFSARRITVAPITILIGYGAVLYGILKRPKPTE